MTNQQETTGTRSCCVNNEVLMLAVYTFVSTTGIEEKYWSVWIAILVVTLKWYSHCTATQHAADVCV